MDINWLSTMRRLENGNVEPLQATALYWQFTMPRQGLLSEILLSVLRTSGRVRHAWCGACVPMDGFPAVPDTLTSDFPFWQWRYALERGQKTEPPHGWTSFTSRPPCKANAPRFDVHTPCNATYHD